MPAADDDLWEEYARTVVELSLPDGATLQITPAPPGQVGPWPEQLTAPVHFLTAWDPGDERPSAEMNRTRQRDLEEELQALAVQTWPSSGFDAQSGHREEGVAVAGLEEDAACALGRRYRQNAIFSWTPDGWHVVSCRDMTRTVMGWHVSQR